MSCSSTVFNDASTYLKIKMIMLPPLQWTEDEILKALFTGGVYQENV